MHSNCRKITGSICGVKLQKIRYFDKLVDDPAKIQCPVFVIGGRQDQVVTGAASEEIVRRLDCECYLYDNLGHAAYEEAADFNRKVYDFLMK